MKKIYLFVLLFFIPVTILLAQEAPFYKDIQHFKELDRQNPPPKNAILFIGSSSFTKWTDVSDYFPGYTIINRGFGGSTLKDLLYYFNDLVPVYKPRQIVIYCGENDLANDQTPADTVVSRFKQLYDLIRNYSKNVPVAYISMKPSPSRARFLPKFIAANAAIKACIQKEKKIRYIDVYDHMLGPDGAPVPGIFVNDSLHMNAGGYHIWQQVIQPYLKK
ncbi:G-D-S-L family lipolytic protein [Niabella ginsenosidivorans]|uniref:G-D-S-L family lipolytic protein n=1 Tax=Niabella ginsenosidivorans TaxID=1176587 RepID=A0A1A9IA37_9BACT|nr:GDSL-type esterase/lipase family protein [Niabella ginsenosidivorans]ANH83414.1 G-D-S-L family lipolytic protein [Niabella ginsenosidivorans]